MLAEINCQYLKGVGPRMAVKLAKLGIYSGQDILFHLPFRYEDRSHLTPIRQLQPSQSALIEAEIINTSIIRKHRVSMICQVKDSTGYLNLRFFHFSNAQRQHWLTGKKVRCYGEVRLSNQGLEMIHPEYQIGTEADFPPLAQTLTPVYPTTEGIGQTAWRQLTDQVLSLLAQERQLQELLPAELLQQLKFPTLKQALQYVHRPPLNVSLVDLKKANHPCQQRLAFEELLAHQLSLQVLRATLQQHAAPALLDFKQFKVKLLENLPFKLTRAQERVVKEIMNDLEKPVPMLRLVQGDVGSGKTVVAAMAVLQAISAGYQAAVMAPTELLAEQHLKNFKQWLEPLGIKIAWLTSQIKGKARTEILTAIATNEVQVIIGTHALFQKEVVFSQLALIVVDEQHRFGVHQRLALKEKGVLDGLVPHQLIMTATPIPRTLAMCAYADLDQSVINELPPGRKPVTTVIIDNNRREEVIKRIQVVCQSGRQVYWVCTLIEESEVLQCQAAEKTYENLTQALPELRIALIHGRLKAKEKEVIMQAFKKGDYHLLVATTVIEVGVDVPNASLMIIENAERLGLAQLHQLRGRVGRGEEASHCVLLFQMPLSHNAKERLAIMKQTNDGFLIAQKDLELRGPGEVLGTKQTGEIDFQVADLLRDQNLLPQVQQIAKVLTAKHAAIVKPLIQRWLGKAQCYGQV
ncbi:MAG: ATP-dependent DNA helicase RecG [Gammaproteobacteria bacterium RIFCSPHIGHO2_12_FULL_35_23]|nr:MAG: ATP-dependent DNA helicase RecG [Gammaproteobacteria bacterium RIFCSPHIGHO2_12_FULL_35_23]